MDLTEQFLRDEKQRAALRNARTGIQALGRNGRWGTCTDCPRSGDGLVLPELCKNTKRSDHQFTMKDFHDYWQSNVQPIIDAAKP